jgi:hypothetical protein
MASFVYVCGIEHKNSADSWKKTDYKSLTAWIAAAGAKTIRIPGLGPAGRYCFALPDGRRVEAELLDEKTMRLPRKSAGRFSKAAARAIVAPLIDKGYPMLKHELRQDDGILVLHPEGPLDAADFTTLARDVDAYLERHGTLRGVLIRAKSFPGWKDFGALLAHLKFLKAHLRRIEKVAIVADGSIATLMPNIANHFVHAQVQHFNLACEDAAWAWLKQSANAELRPAA